jgi:hypothetical protein
MHKTPQYILPVPLSRCGYRNLLQLLWLALTLVTLPLWSHAQVTNGLAVHLTFDNNYNDTSGNGINGTAVGSPKFVPGIIGQAVSVTTLKDGSEYDYVTLGYPPLLQFADNVDFTVSFWCNYTNQVDDPPFISNKNWQSSGNIGWGIFTQDGGNFRVNVTGDGGGAKQSTSSTPIVRDGTWHNIVVSFARQSSVNIYVDGSLALTNNLSQTTGSIDTDPSAMAVNVGQDGTGQYTDGGSAQMVGVMIDDLGIWRRALTATEVSAIYSNGKAGKSFDVQLVLPPGIVSQPQDQTHYAGITVPLTLNATGVSNTYQWSLNGTNVLGATNTTLILTNVQNAQAGSYTVKVSNAGGSTNTQPFKLTVLPLASGAPVTNALAAHLPFDGNYKDSSPNAVNGTAVGNPTFVPGKIGQAVSVTTLKDGSEFDYVTLGYPDVLKFSSNVDFTISFWANYTNQVDDPPFVSNKNWNSSGNVGWGIFTQDGGNFRVNVTGDGGGKESTTHVPTIRDGTWHNVAVTFSRTGSADIYVDGEFSFADQLTQVLGSIDTDPSTMAVNVGQDGTGGYTDGGSAEMVGVQIDDLGIWRRVLSNLEVEYIYLQGKGGVSFDVPPPAPALPAYAIGLNFGADEVNGNNAASLGATNIAGATGFAQTDWNNLKLKAGTNNTLVAEVAGTSTPISTMVTWSANGTWATTGRGEENNKFTGADKTLLTGYLDMNAPNQTTTITITGIPDQLTSNGYDVLVYAYGSVGGRGGGYRILDAGNGAVLKDYVRAQSPTNATAYIEIPDKPSGTNKVWTAGTHIRFTGLASQSIQIQATTVSPWGFGGTQRAPIDAVQLVPTSSVVQPVIESVTRNADGSLTVTWSGGGSLQAATSLPAGQWQDIPNSKSPFTFKPASSPLFGRIKK